MNSVDQETAVEQFFDLARSCQQRRLKAAEVAREIADFFRDVRIEGADLDSDGDMLLFQWGASEQLSFAEPTDLRTLPDSKLKFDKSASQYLDFTRQVFVSSGDDDDEGDEADDEEDFDDAAIQMSLTLVYGPATGDEESENLWISTPNELDRSLKKHASQKFVASLLKAEPTRYVATVGLCG